MKESTTIQERLWDLRKERGLNLEELAEATGISKSALATFESDEYKEINHGNLLKLAKFYGVSTDYILCLTENRDPAGTELNELHLTDEMVDLLKSGRINNRLLCEIATNEDFLSLMTDTEIFVDGIATKRFRDMNAVLAITHSEILAQYQPVEEDLPLQTLKASQIQEEDYFCHVTHRSWDRIIRDIRKKHVDDTDSESDTSDWIEMIENIHKVRKIPGTYLDVFCAALCSGLKIPYEKLTELERNTLRNIMRRSPAYKNSPLRKQKRK